MADELIKSGTFVMVDDEPSAGRFVRWFEYGVSDEDLPTMGIVVLMGDGRIRVVDAERVRVQMEGTDLEISDSCPNGYSLGVDWDKNTECLLCSKNSICFAYHEELLEE